MRLADWQIRLQCVLDEDRHRRFAWGKMDCVRLTAKVIHAVTGREIRLPLYENERQATALLNSTEFITVLTRWMTNLGYRTIEHHRRGDVVMIGTRTAPWFYACGVVDLSGRRVVVCGEEGLVFMPRRRITYGWAID